MEAKKIIQVITRLDKGGSADIFLHLASVLKKRGHEIKIISGHTTEPTTNLNEYTKETGISIGFVETLIREVSLINDLKALFQLYSLFKKEKPDIVHLHTSKAGFIGRIAAKLAGVKCIVFTTHGHIFYGYFSKLKTQIFIYMEYFSAFFGDAITTLTEMEKKDFCDLRITTPEKIEAVPNGLDGNFQNIEKGLFRKEINVNDGTLLIGWCGRFTDIKGPDIFLNISGKLKPLASNENVKVVMLGDGEMFNEIQKKTKKMGLEDFLLLPGYREDTKPFMKDIDILALTSRNEGFGMVILEAMAAKKPIVAFDVGGVKELVDDKSTGYMVEFGDETEMVAKIRNLIQDKSLMIEMGGKGYEKSKEYTFEEMVTKFESLYAKILALKH